MSKSHGNARLMMKCFFGAILALATVSWAGEVTEITHDLTGNELVAVYCQTLNDGFVYDFDRFQLLHKHSSVH